MPSSKHTAFRHLVAALALTSLVVSPACTGAGSDSPRQSTESAAQDVGGVPSVGESEFDQVLASADQPVLVDFWAPWCGPCRALAPRVEAVAAEMGARLRVVKVNVDDAPGLARRYSASSIPLLVVFRKGRVVARAVGYMPTDAVRKLVVDAGA